MPASTAAGPPSGPNGQPTPTGSTASWARTPRAGPAPPPGPSARTPLKCLRLHLTQPTLWPIRIIPTTRCGLRRGLRVSHLPSRSGDAFWRGASRQAEEGCPRGGGAADRAQTWRQRLRAVGRLPAQCSMSAGEQGDWARSARESGRRKASSLTRLSHPARGRWVTLRASLGDRARGRKMTAKCTGFITIPFSY